MSIAEFRTLVASNRPLAGTFMKTPSVDILEVLILSGLDFVCIDAEHAPFDRQTLNACLALARAADFPVLIRVASGKAENIGAALDLGAVGIVVPHVTDADVAARVAKAARFGHGGRGYAGSTRWAGYATRKMPDLLAQSEAETVVIAQIEDPEAVEACETIAATPGIDALFLGPADLTVAYGQTDQDCDELHAAMARVGEATSTHGKAYMTFVADADRAKALRKYGFGAVFIASEHAWILGGARAQIAGIREIE
ncbi:HpcH/HpaI aldolase family protein [Jannaschia sp. CCS1]|uniref:HpcH/HpaI aldolase family protein n=1 Tax=Jannaschia sp. (strain CCS1) TaxID=290400 RepID=UPI000053C286|nr:aldolase/citrate lyase family protein [Jannaschia sp. CCS1]ABD55608.1 HpcH/HpaI aldolase [Jannaschia sp. CCS1]